MVVLYNASVRLKVEYASVIWHNLTLTDSNKIEIMHRKFAKLCYCRSFTLAFYVIMIYFEIFKFYNTLFQTTTN
jgi:hypothetical protein